MSEEKAKRKRKYQHWSKFVAETPSIRKSKKRGISGLCIGCGKRPCECRHPTSKRAF